MSADLFLPIVFIVIMYVIIGCVEDGLTLLAIGMIFIPIAFMFTQIVNSGGYTLLFGASLVSGIQVSIFISGGMLLIPIFAIGKLLYIRNVARRSGKHE